MKWTVREWAAVAAILGVSVPATLALGQSFLVAPVDARLTTHIAVQQTETAVLAAELAEIKRKIDALHFDCVSRGGCRPHGGNR